MEESGVPVLEEMCFFPLFSEEEEAAAVFFVCFFVTKAGQAGALCCQRCRDFWASLSRVSKSNASYLLFTGPGPASSRSM